MSGKNVDNILKKLEIVYCCKENEIQERSISELYAPDASFEDNLMKVQGIDNIKIQFKSLFKIFSKIEFQVQDTKIEESETSLELSIKNRQIYFGYPDSWFIKRPFDMNVTTKITLAKPNLQIVKHHDVWESNPFPVLNWSIYQNYSKGIMGTLSSAILKFTIK